MDFLGFLFDGLEGTAYLAFKTGSKWEQRFYQWPEEKSKIIEDIDSMKEGADVYISPSLFSQDNASKDFWLVSQVVWVENDSGRTPREFNFPSESVRISSGSNGHFHHYWRLTAPIRDSGTLEVFNRQLCKAFDGDPSGTNCNKVLRVPGTYNFKYNPSREVSIDQVTNNVIDEFHFITLPETNSYEPSLSEELIPVKDLCKRYVFSTKFWSFYSGNIQDGSRAKALVSVAISACNLGMNDTEIFSLLLDADTRWGKYVGRQDRTERLSSIISYARDFISVTNGVDVKGGMGSIERPMVRSTRPLSEISKLTEDTNVWLVPQLLPESSMGCVFSPPEVGKTQFSLNLGMSLASGEDFLVWKNIPKKKVLFISLEMTEYELALYLADMLKIHGNKFDENFHVVVEPDMDLKFSESQSRLLTYIDDFNPDLIIIDSLSTAVGGELSPTDWEPVSKFMMSEVRTKRKKSVWWIHHSTKPNFNNRKPTKLEDMYGSTFLARDMSTVLSLWKVGDEIEVGRAKGRVKKSWSTFLVKRNDDLSFSLASTGLRHQ